MEESLAQEKPTRARLAAGEVVFVPGRFGYNSLTVKGTMGGAANGAYMVVMERGGMEFTASSCEVYRKLAEVD